MRQPSTKLRLQSRRRIEHGLEENTVGTEGKKMFSDQIVSFVVHQKTEYLDAKIENSIDYLLTALIDPELCRVKWYNDWNQTEAEELFSHIMESTHRMVRAALNVVEGSFWNLNSLCDTSINPAVFSYIRDRTGGFNSTYEIEYKRPKINATKHSSTSTPIGIISTRNSCSSTR